MRMSPNPTAETVLIVDDEEPVRRTFREWLDGAELGCRVLTAANAADALRLADGQPIDLAILDWNLGAGSDGLQLLEDLKEFSPDVVAVMITGFANQATPLMAMRMGVRDYLDKNQDLNRQAFLRAVVGQLDVIRPARRARLINQGLAAFRAAVEQVLPLVQAAAALHDPVPLPTAVHSLFAFLLSTTGATGGALLVHSHDSERCPEGAVRAYGPDGQPLPGPFAPFARSLASSVVSLGEPHALEGLEQVAAEGTIELMPFERGRRSVLAAPIDVAPGLLVVLELFDKPGPFTDADRRLLRAAAGFGADLLRQALAERQTHRVLFDAVAAAMRAGDEVAQALRAPPAASPTAPPPADVLQRLQAGLREEVVTGIDAEATLRLAEGIRVLAVRYGPAAVRHCTRLVEDLRKLLDEVSGVEGEARP
jgi:two-component system, NtrC family, nitrogen regulation response regulator NtrX